jgi:hypothetical protein
MKKPPDLAPSNLSCVGVNAQVDTMRDVFEDISEEVKEGLEDGCEREISRRVDLRCVWKTQSMPSGVTEVAGAWIWS